jgi:hypothetical protein
MKKLILILILALIVPCKGFSQLGDPITNHESFFMPGGGYGMYFPTGLDSSGYYSGAVVEYLFYNKINQTDSWGPSHVRFYGKLQILKGSTEEMHSLFAYNLGVDFSLERNPRRNVFIPYFGVETGGLSGKTYGTNFCFYPLAGLRILAFKRITWGVSGSYAYPIKNFEVFKGWQAQSTINFSLW